MNTNSDELPLETVNTATKARRRWRGTFVFTAAGHRVHEHSDHVGSIQAHDVDVTAEVYENLAEVLFTIGACEVRVAAVPSPWWAFWTPAKLQVSARFPS